MVKLSNGWIKLHRKILDCFIWQDKPYDKARAWIDLLLIAMHHDKKMLIDDEVVMIQRGSFMTSIVKLADRWGWSRNKVVRYLDMLESEHMLNTKRTSKGTLVTIVKYDDYQLCDMSCEATNESADESTNETPNESTNGATDESADESQNKNNKELKNNVIRSNSDDLNDTDKPKKKKQKLSDEENQELIKNFEIIYSSYPKKVGKASGFKVYKQWLNGRDIGGTKIKLTNRQMWYAIAKYKQYIENEEMEMQYVKQFDTFMRNILDYVEDEQ